MDLFLGYVGILYKLYNVNVLNKENDYLPTYSEICSVATRDTISV